MTVRVLRRTNASVGPAHFLLICAAAWVRRAVGRFARTPYGRSAIGARVAGGILRTLGGAAHLSIARIAGDVAQALRSRAARNHRAADFPCVAGRFCRTGHSCTGCVAATRDVRDERIASVTRWVRFTVCAGRAQLTRRTAVARRGANQVGVNPSATSSRQKREGEDREDGSKVHGGKISS
jgi:hypothetical protein